MTPRRLFLPAAALLLSCGGAPPPTATPWPSGPTPPVAAQHPYQVPSPNGARADEYYWLRDDSRSKPEVLGYLQAEEDYAQAMLAPGQALRERLVGEMRGRIQETDTDVPVFDDGYWYYQRFEAGKEYPIHCRRKGTMDAAEEIILDVNQAAAGQAYYRATHPAVAPGGKLLAWGADTTGRFQYTIHVKDLTSGQVLPDTLANVEDSIEWTADGRTLLYIEKDPVTLLGYKVRKHVIGTDRAADPLVREETDRSFYTSLGHCKSKRFLFIAEGSTVSSEWWYADAADPALTFHLLLPRERDHEYEVDHVAGRFVIRSNWKATNFRLVEAPEDAPGDRARWRDVIAHRDDAFVDGFEPFADFVVVAVRSGGLARVVLHFWDGKQTEVAADETAYTATLSPIPAAGGSLFRYRYTSMTTPWSTYQVDVRTGARTLLKRQPVPGYDPAGYATERLEATARDGTKVPVVIVHKKGLARDGSAPLYQIGYGSYGISYDPEFSSNEISLLDRGFVVAIAQIRGGQELGRHWYEDGKLLHKRNTFTDFIDVTEFLIAHKIAARDQVFASGASAGGLLMGAIANLRPDLYRGIIAHVPFVDVVTTMLDDSIPLTTNEYDEWGDPREKKYYD
ncbi:MAG TPA: S9 family peptidase, partial [Kofleriaceae bacterium]|nr:S9 family peptidase [Kofleriaceae bacterium]